MSNNYLIDKKAQEICQPFLTVFSAEDGGISFLKFRHQLLPGLIEDTSNENSKLILDKIEQVGRLLNHIAKS